MSCDPEKMVSIYFWAYPQRGYEMKQNIADNVKKPSTIFQWFQNYDL